MAHIAGYDLSVAYFSPKNFDSMVPTGTSIKIDFNKKLNKGSILKSVAIIEDINSTVESINDLASSKILPVLSDITYSDYRVEAKPKEALKENTKYVVVVRSSIEAVDGSKMINDLFFSFTTAVKEDLELGEIKITNPLESSIIREFERIEFVGNGSENYTVQISNTSDFALILFEQIVFKPFNIAMIDRNFEDGTYYIRIKSEKSEWKDPIQVYLQKYETGIVSSLDDIDSLDEFDFFNDKITVEDISKVPISQKSNKKIFRVNKIISPFDLKIALASIFDFKEDEYFFEDVKITSFSLYIHEENTYIIVEL